MELASIHFIKWKICRASRWGITRQSIQWATQRQQQPDKWALLCCLHGRATNRHEGDAAAGVVGWKIHMMGNLSVNICRLSCNCKKILPLVISFQLNGRYMTQIWNVGHPVCLNGRYMEKNIEWNINPLKCIWDQNISCTKNGISLAVVILF